MSLELTPHRATKETNKVLDESWLAPAISKVWSRSWDEDRFDPNSREVRTVVLLADGDFREAVIRLLQEHLDGIKVVYRLDRKDALALHRRRHLGGAA